MIEIIAGTIIIALFYRNMRKNQARRNTQTDALIEQNKRILDSNDR